PDAQRRGHRPGRQPHRGGRPHRAVRRRRHRGVRRVGVPARRGGVLVRRGRPADPTPPRARAVSRSWHHAVTLAVLLLVWSAVAAADIVQPTYLTPSPREVWDAFVRANTHHAIGGGVDRVVRGEEGYFLWE